MRLSRIIRRPLPWGTRLLAAACLPVVASALAACGGGGPGGVGDARDPAAADVDLLVARLEAAHPYPWHAVSRAAFTAAAERLKTRLPELGPDARLVELMRLTALLGEHDGHTGLFPLDTAHRRPLHLYPIRLYAFADGLRVVAAPGSRSLAGARLVAVAGMPAGAVLRRVRPLVPRDNPSSRDARAPQWLVTAEVLHGLGVVGAAGPARFRFELPGGGAVERVLTPIPAARYAAAFPDLFHPMVPQGLPRRASPPFLARRERPSWTATLASGRVVYAAYNVTLGAAGELAADVVRRASAPPARGVVLDLRHNPGGENATYVPLLEALRGLGRRERLVVLVSRTTFSAAANLLADLERTTPLTIVGEPSGGSPNLYGDPTPVRLPATGWTVHVATVWWEKSRRGAGDQRTAFRPDAAVPLRYADLAAGRDRALARAVALAGGLG